MSKNLLIEEVTEKGRQVLGELQDGMDIPIGREPGEGGVVLDVEAVSRIHGVFFSKKDYWFYRDNGSTNGSWINGREVRSGQVRLIRPGDVIQIANAALQVRESGRGTAVAGRFSEPVGIFGRSALVFMNDNFADEFPIPEYGKAVVIGGSNCDLALEGDLKEAPSLVIERRKSSVVAYSVSKALPIAHNGELIDGTVELHDGDEVKIQEYTILYQDPSDVKISRPTGVTVEGSYGEGGVDDGQRQAIHGGDRDEEFDEFALDRKPKVNVFFGKQSLDDEGEDDLYGVKGQGGSERGFRSSVIFPPGDMVEDGSYSSLENKIILVVIFLLLVALVVLAMFLVWG